MCNNYLKHDCLDEGIDGGAKLFELLLEKASALEAPEQDATLAEDGEEVQHVLDRFNQMK